MNKNLVIGVVALLLLGGAAYALQNRKSDSSAPQSDKEVMSESREFAAAMESGKPTTCIMTKGEDVMEYSLKGKKMRIKTTTAMDSGATPAKPVIGHMINDETYFYTWEDSSKQGSKISLTLASPTTESNTSVEAAPKLESEADYQNLKNEGYTINCQSASFDDSFFTPPADIKFIDPTQFMQPTNSGTGAGSSTQINMEQLKELQQQYANQ
jgi:hypothetical protein